MKERLEDKHSKDSSSYVSNIKDNIKRRYSNYKMNKFREQYRDGLKFEENAEYKKAIRNYLACLEMEPRNLKCMSRLANLYSNLEENSKSLELFSKLVKLHPNEETYFQLGQELYRQNYIKKAIQSLKNSLYYNKRFINSHILLASLYIKANNTDKTEQYLSNALKINPNHKTCLEELMMCYYRQGRYRDSLRIMNQYTSLYAEDTSLKLLKSDLYTKIGSYTKSLKLLYQTTSSDDRFLAFSKEMQYRRINPTAREKEFINRITAIKNKKLVSFKSKLQDYYNEVSNISPNPKDAYDLSILYLLIGNQKKALKYLVFARQLNEEKKYS
jgi:tetratricopeptide (TPR) repeat protein